MARRNLGFYLWWLLVNSNGPGHHRSHFVSKTTQPLTQPRSLPKISSHTLHSLHHLLSLRRQPEPASSLASGYKKALKVDLLGSKVPMSMRDKSKGGHEMPTNVTPKVRKFTY